MATYSLSGAGTQALSAGVTALNVTVTTLPANAGQGGATPADYYGVGSLRPGNAAAFWEPFNVCGGPQWMPVPYGSTRLGYAITQGAVVSVVEVFTSPPFAFPLALLPDVALSSPADTQVLTYQATTSKWINAAAASGGGGGSAGLVLLQTQTLVAAAAQVDFTPPSSGYSEIRINWQTQLDGGSTPQECRVRLNSDASALYNYGAFHGAAGQSTTGFGFDNLTYVRVGNIAPNSVGNASSAGEVRFPDYQNSLWYKQIDALFWNIETAMQASQMFAGMVHGTWRNAGAITAIRLFPGANNFRIGSVFRMYGMV